MRRRHSPYFSSIPLAAHFPQHRSRPKNRTISHNPRDGHGRPALNHSCERGQAAMRAVNRWCWYGGAFMLFAAGGTFARGQEPPPPPAPAELPVTVEPAPPPAAQPAPTPATPAPAAVPTDGQATPAADGQASPAPECKPWTAKVPTPDKFPPLGWTLIFPDGPGYYSLLD